MKCKKIIFSLLIFLALLLFSTTCSAITSDVINNYDITVEPRKNGFLDMTYEIEWEVLDSKHEGPLKWINIGIPHSNVSNITAISKNIKKISYFQDNGDFIRIALDREYEENSILNIKFKFTQSHMYSLEGNTCKYSFTPGWFDKINVKELTIRWKSDNVSQFSPKASNVNGYFTWTKKNLLKGLKYTVNVEYPASALNTDINMQYSDATISSNKNILSILPNGFSFMFLALVGIAILSSVISMFSGYGYYSHRGLGYSSYSWFDDDYDWSRSSRSCVSSCACACACAGGGRAGCSKKDLYGATIKTQKLNKILN